MKRVLELPIDISNYENQSVITIHVTPEAIQVWCLELFLLEKRLIESIVIVAHSHKLSVAIDEEATRAKQGCVKWRTQGADIILSPTELSSLVRFSLKYYRDGIGDVDHLDIDLRSEPLLSNTAGVYLTLTVPLSQPPVTAEEARQRLGLSKRKV